MVLTTTSNRNEHERRLRMKTEQGLLDSALRNWRINMDRAGKFFGSLSDEELQIEVAPGRNRLIYVWGHLTAINDAILPLLGFGPKQYPELDLLFLSNPDRALPKVIAGPELKHIWMELDDVLWKEFAKLSPADWLARHNSVSPEDFDREPHRNRYSVLLGRTTHLAYHHGQAILAKRKVERLHK